VPETPSIYIVIEDLRPEGRKVEKIKGILVDPIEVVY
jgi:hypothetical protein